MCNAAAKRKHSISHFVTVALQPAIKEIRAGLPTTISLVNGIPPGDRSKQITCNRPASTVSILKAEAKRRGVSLGDFMRSCLAATIAELKREALR